MQVKKSTVKKDSSAFREKSVDSSNIPMEAYCIFCGSNVGQISELTVDWIKSCKADFLWSGDAL